MTVEVIENFTSYQQVSDLKPMYVVDGPGATGNKNLLIAQGRGPTTMTGQDQSPRTPVNTLMFLGKDNSAGSNYAVVDIYNYDLGYNVVQSQFKSVAFNYRPIAGEVASSTDTVECILSIYCDLAVSPVLNIRIGHSLEYFDAPDNGYPGGGVDFTLYEGASGSSTTRLWSSLIDGDEETAQAAGLTYAAGSQNGSFLEYGKWYHIELYCYANGGSSTVELRINGHSVFFDDGVALDSAQYIERIEMRAGASGGTAFYGSGHQYEVTDIVVVDWSTGFADWTFPAVVDTVKVTTEVVGEIDFTPQTGTDNAAMVDEVPHDYDTTYNESNTAGHKDRFSTTNQVPYTAVNGDVYALKVQAIVKDTVFTGTRTARVVCYENVTEGLGDTVTISESGYMTLQHVFDTNPDTSAAWTKAEVNAAEVGYEFVSLA